jgi:hypothetical protein
MNDSSSGLSNRAAGFIVFMVCLFVVEAMVRLAVFLNLLPYQTYQTSVVPEFKDSINEAVGVWNYPSAKSRVFKSCFDVPVSSNSVGAADRERTLTSASPQRVVVLGDSFTEGYGVEQSQRFSNLLEQATGTEHMNFALEGQGTIQEWLVYETMAKQFDHSAVFVFVLPFNDFINNDAKSEGQPLYRPLLKESDGGFDVFYKISFEERPRKRLNMRERAKNTIDNQLYVANILRWGLREVKSQFEDKHDLEQGTRVLKNYYDTVSDLDLRIFFYSLERIIENAGDRPFYIFLIPVSTDFEYAQREGYEFELVRRLQAFQQDHGTVEVIDLLPYFLRHAEENGLEYADYLHSCDAHWSALGHQVAAEAIIEGISNSRLSGVESAAEFRQAGH